MKTTGNTVLITGGATGIGLALAAAFVEQGNITIICGRREQRLGAAQQALPGVHVRRCDVASAADRTELAAWATATFPALNIVINNAGIQRTIDFRQGAPALLSGEDEIETDLRAPIHLSALFIPHLVEQPEAAIVNVTSGLAFIPSAMFPVYCATKAALHSFSWTLRHQLRQTTVRVFEVIPPWVDTELNSESRRQRVSGYRGISPEIVAQDTLKGMRADTFEITVGDAQGRREAARNDPEGAFNSMNAW